MSDVYIRRLRRIRDELAIATEVFRFVHTNWHKQDVVDSLRPRTPKQVQNVADSLEVTYFVRLTAEFEGVLKDHLRSNHPAIAIPVRRSDWTVDWFISRLVQREKLQITAELRHKLNEIRDYRNSIAHGNPGPAVIAFTDALARYNTFLAKLPDPFEG